MKTVLLLALLLPFSCYAEGDVYTMIIKDHKFSPAEIRVPAGKKVKLLIENQDSTPEEFESHSLHREKIIAAKGKATINVGPLAAGRYTFEGEFNPKTAQGVLIAE